MINQDLLKKLIAERTKDRAKYLAQQTSPQAVQDIQDAQSFLADVKNLRISLEIGKRIKSFTPSYVLSLIKKIHKLAGKYDYRDKLDKIGEYRKDITFMMRTPPSTATYFLPQHLSSIIEFLKSEGNSPQQRIDFLYGQGKFFPHKSQSECEKYRAMLEIYKKKYPEHTFSNQFDTPCSVGEQQMLALIYKIFPSHTTVSQDMTALAEAFIKNLHNKHISVEQLVAFFMLEFMRIHPFENSNKRTLRLFINEVLLANKSLALISDKQMSELFTPVYGKPELTLAELETFCKKLLITKTVESNASTSTLSSLLSTTLSSIQNDSTQSMASTSTDSTQSFGVL